MHLWASNNNRIIGSTGRLKKKIPPQDLNRKFWGAINWGYEEVGSSRGEREREVDGNVR